MYFLDSNPFRYCLVSSRGILLQTHLCHFWMDAECQPGAVWAQLHHGVLLLLVLHDFKPAGKTRGGKAADTDDVVIWDCQGSADMHKRGGWTQWDACNCCWTLAGGSKMIFHFVRRIMIIFIGWSFSLDIYLLLSYSAKWTIFLKYQVPFFSFKISQQND